MARTAIVGAGVIGLTLAYELIQRGDDVVVVDRRRPGAGSSAGNAGWIVPSMASPVASPGLPWTAMKWMASPESPLYIKPRLDPGFLRWLWSFFRACREEDYRTGREALLSLAGGAQAGFDRLRAGGVEFEMTSAGLLVLALDTDMLDHHFGETESLSTIGYTPARRLTGPEVREIEPVLSNQVAGGVLITADRHVRPESLVAGLAEALERSGASVIGDSEVVDFLGNGRSIRALKTTSAHVEADRFVLAAGTWSGELARRVGVKLPLEAGKGYSITVDQPSYEIRHPLDLLDVRAAVTPFEGAVRFAGTMELSGVNLRYVRRRAEAIWRNAHQYLREPMSGARMRAWVGMRPMTPDGLPIIGRLPGKDNLYVATGHQMLGVTLAPTTATALAELMTGEPTSISLAPFDPVRFL